MVKRAEDPCGRACLQSRQTNCSGDESPAEELLYSRCPFRTLLASGKIPMSNPDQASSLSTPDELAAFMESHRRQLLAYVDRNIGPALKSRVEPEDIVQEVIVSAFSSIDQFQVEGRDPFRLLCQLAEQRIIDAHRHHVGAKKRTTAREVSMDAPVPGGDGFGFINMLVASITSPSQAFSRDQKQFQLQEAIAELSDEQREVLRLRFVEGLPTKEIADRIGKSDGAIRVLLTRTVAHLQEILGTDSR